MDSFIGTQFQARTTAKVKRNPWLAHKPDIRSTICGLITAPFNAPRH